MSEGATGSARAVSLRGAICGRLGSGAGRAKAGTLRAGHPQVHAAAIVVLGVQTDASDNPHCDKTADGMPH